MHRHRRGSNPGHAVKTRRSSPSARGEEPQEAAVPGIRATYASGMEMVFRSGVSGTANTGLIYDRYAAVWSPPPQCKPADSARVAFFQEIREHLRNRRTEGESLLQQFHARRAALWDAIGAEPVEIALAAPLVSGLGMGHPLEAGFVWDRNLGVPYVPGTGLKGVARAWAEHWQGADESICRRIFGDTADAGAGSIIFFSAFPKRIPDLRLDVMNPHFAEYYEAPQKVAPADWLSPRPLFFLTVATGTTFIAAVGPRATHDAGPARSGSEMNTAIGLLRDALANIGVGAKTAVGYGYFR